MHLRNKTARDFTWKLNPPQQRHIIVLVLISDRSLKLCDSTCRRVLIESQPTTKLSPLTEILTLSESEFRHSNIAVDPDSKLNLSMAYVELLRKRAKA